MGKWLLHGAPACIINTLTDPGIFPPVDQPAAYTPESLYCDEISFKNYPGVEEQDVTEQEMQAHFDKGHLMAFGTYEELAASINGQPVLNKLGLIIKTRNGITKARTILDTKESGVKWITSKTQRVTLSRLLDAVLRMLFLLAISTDKGDTVKAFVLNFPDAFWQMPVCPSDRRFFCATAKIKGKRKYLALCELLRAVQMLLRYGDEWRHSSCDLAKDFPLVTRSTSSATSTILLQHSGARSSSR